MKDSKFKITFQLFSHPDPSADGVGSAKKQGRSLRGEYELLQGFDLNRRSNLVDLGMYDEIASSNTFWVEPLTATPRNDGFEFSMQLNNMKLNTQNSTF